MLDFFIFAIGSLTKHSIENYQKLDDKQKEDLKKETLELVAKGKFAAKDFFYEKPKDED